MTMMDDDDDGDDDDDDADDGDVCQSVMHTVSSAPDNSTCHD